MQRTQRLRIAAMLILGHAYLPAIAQTSAACASSSPLQRVPLVELYTSEGCSSCPPAEAWLAEVAPRYRGKIVALAWHVDYWDQLGWRDPYANKRFTARQRELAQQNRSRSIYTPGLFINGIEFGPDASPESFHGLIQRWQTRNSDYQLHLSWQTPHQATIKIQPVTTGQITPSNPPLVHLVLFQSDLQQTISQGENRGRTLTHHYVVRHWFEPQRLEQATLTRTIQLNDALLSPLAATTSPYGLAAFLQDPVSGQILQSWSQTVCSRKGT
ncbi:DUF1223 domain-containing protein [Parvibium lacunae]|uniref:DUF1223 domain-containing protein n=1 Tax=Parvibium lacunae TaxID=1888893 RepID=A0A368L4A9_9BURK|nr:DUF1223 domain-containing protein [Parvibium lacunae]RCS58418.1 DUF1223 domain-containing protein [Parvibium lacunae]